MCEFPLDANLLNDVEKPTRDCLRLNFVLRKEYQFLKNALTKEEISKSKHFNSLTSYHQAMRFLLKAYEFFYRQAEYPVVLNPDKLNRECKELIMNYMGDCSTEERIHQKITELQCYRNKSATLYQGTLDTSIFLNLFILLKDMLLVFFLES